MWTLRKSDLEGVEPIRGVNDLQLTSASMENSLPTVPDFKLQVILEDGTQKSDLVVLAGFHKRTVCLLPLLSCKCLCQGQMAL
jgi:hypothetical protein